MFTLNNLKSIGVESYFSGCITLTIPKMPETADKGEYICSVDIAKKAREKLRSDLDGKIEVREISHLRERDETIPWEVRKKNVEELLTVYQNARCVVTRRLHCALPCLAMGVPVLLVRGDEDDTRFDPYYSFLNHASVDEFIQGNFDYDFLNPPENSSQYKQYADKLTSEVQAFIDSVKDEKRSADELYKPSFTEQDIKNWRHDVMKNALDIWLDDDHRKHEKEVANKRELANVKRQLNKSEQTLIKRTERIQELKDKINDKNAEIKQLRTDNKSIDSELSKTKLELEKLRNEPLRKTIARKLKHKRA